MGFDISYHPIGIDQMNAWYFDRLAEVAQEDFSQLEKVGKDAGLEEFYIDKYIETMKTSSTPPPEAPFEKHHAYCIAVVQGFFLPYFYTRGTALSFLLEETPELKKYITSWSSIKPESIVCPVADGLVENYSGGIYISAKQVSELLADLERETETKDLFTDFFEENFPVFVKALKYAEEHGLGLLEATEVVEPNPINLNETVSYSNLFNCDKEGAFIYEKIALEQIKEAISNTQPEKEAKDLIEEGKITYQKIFPEQTEEAVSDTPQKKESYSFKSFIKKLFGKKN